MPDAHARIVLAGIELELQGPEVALDRSVGRLLSALQARSGGDTERAERREAASAADSAEEAPRYVPPTDRFGLFKRQRTGMESAVPDAPADHIASYAFFLWNYERKEVFHEAEVDGCFRADGVAPPPDLASAYGDLLSRRVLAPGEQDRTWRLTGKGRDYVRHHLM